MRWTEVGLIAVSCAAVLGADGCPPPVISRINVETTEPEISADGLCSLIEAIENANSRSGLHADCETPEGWVEIVLGKAQTYTLIESYESDFGLPIISEGFDIVGNGSTIQRAGGASPFGIIGGEHFGLNDLTIRNSASGDPGVWAISDVRLENCRVTDCDIGVSVLQGVTITRSVVDANRIGILASCGYPPIISRLKVIIKSSTINGNVGGGIRIEGCTERDSMLELINSTVTGNSAEKGGGVFLSDAVARVWSSTIVDNVAFSEGGGIYSQESSITDTWRSIVARNEGLNCISADVSAIASRGFNLTDDDWCKFNQSSDMRVTDAMLSELGDWGGPTPTQMPLPGSPAIDMAGACQGRDQRGYIRPWDGNGDGEAFCDCGSAEVGSHAWPQFPDLAQLENLPQSSGW